MSGYLAFLDKFKDEAFCINALAELKWPEGFSCDKCQDRKAYHLASRPRLFECAACGCQHSVTAGTIFHKTRTPLRKWFIAGYLIAHDKRGVSALYISRELAMRYDTAWLMCHKIRHALTESSSDFLLNDYVEVDEVFYGGRKRKGNWDRTQNAGKTLIVCAVEKRGAAETKNKGIEKQGFIAGSARIAVLSNAKTETIGGFIRSNIKAGTTIINPGFNSYTNPRKYKNHPMLQNADANASVVTPIAHMLLSNVKVWLNGTHHGVSTKHLPRYLREWNYRFNRRGRIHQLDWFLLRRTVGRRTITYADLIAGKAIEGSI